jgi:hypothetical protein
MASLSPSGKPWGQKSQNRNEHASLILAETQQLLDIVSPKGTTTTIRGRPTPIKGKAITPTVAKAFLGSVLEFFQNAKGQKVQ